MSYHFAGAGAGGYKKYIYFVVRHYINLMSKRLHIFHFIVICIVGHQTIISERKTITGIGNNNETKNNKHGHGSDLEKRLEISKLAKVY